MDIRVFVISPKEITREDKATQNPMNNNIGNRMWIRTPNRKSSRMAIRKYEKMQNSLVAAATSIAKCIHCSFGFVLYPHLQC